VPDRLLVSGNYLQVIDLWSGRIVTSPAVLQRLAANLAPGVHNVVPAVVARAGFLAVQEVDDAVYAVPGTVSGSPRLLGKGQLLPAARPDAVWIWGGAPGHLVMVTGTGRRIAGPVPGLADPGGILTVDALSLPGGLIVENGGSQNGPSSLGSTGGLWLWNPLRGPMLQPLVRGCASPVAAQGSLLAWLRCDPAHPYRISLHITDTTTGADRVIANPLNATPFPSGQPVGAFSPDRRWLAAFYTGATFGGYAVGLVNVRTGATSIIGARTVINATAFTPIMWTSDSTRIFFATGASSFDNNQQWTDGTVPFATYRLGARATAELRLHEPSATLLAVIPTGGR
jgi:hypothetical protein